MPENILSRTGAGWCAISRRWPMRGVSPGSRRSISMAEFDPGAPDWPRAGPTVLDPPKQPSAIRPDLGTAWPPVLAVIFLFYAARACAMLLRRSLKAAAF